MAQVLADLDVEIKAEVAMTGDPVEEPGDLLGVLVIRRHSRAHQPVRRGQLLEHVDPHAMLSQQFIGGIHRRRPRPDNGHRQRLTAGMHLRGRDHRGELRRRRQLHVGRSLGVERGVDLNERQLFAFQPVVGRYRPDRAGAHTRTTVDAGDRIDVEHLRRREARLIRRRMNAIHRTGEDTGPVVTARLGNNVRHKGTRSPYAAGTAVRC